MTRITGTAHEDVYTAM